MLMDWLEIPMLRKRSMDFVRRELLSKVTSRASFSKEEKIFAVFGVLAVVYTFVAIGTALFLWQSRVANALGEITDLGGWVPWVLMGVGAIVIGIPLSLALAVLGSRIVIRLRNLVFTTFLEGKQANQLAALVLAALAASVPALLVASSRSDDYTVVAGTVALLVGLVFVVRTAPLYLGSQLQWFFLGVPWLLATLVAGRILIAAGGSVGDIGEILALGVGPAVLLASLVYLSPTLASFSGTVLQGAWSLMAGGSIALVSGSLVAISTTGDSSDALANFLAVLVYAMLAAGAYRTHQRLRSLRPEPPAAEGDTVTDTERLSSAIKFVVENTIEVFVQVHGRRARRALERRFNTAASSEQWGVEIKDGHIAEAGEGGLLERSQRYASALSGLFSVNSRMAGRRFMDRQLRSLYRVMPWEQREIGDEYLFFRLDWMPSLGRTRRVSKGRYTNILRSSPVFERLGDEEIQSISERLQRERHARGQNIITQGEPGRKFYIIESGAVEVRISRQDGTESVEAELGPGDHFGERALLTDAPRAATCRCKTRVRVLSLDRDDFNAMVAKRFNLLRSAPLFAGLSQEESRTISDRLRWESHPKGREIVKQGEPGSKFYLIESGTVEVWVRGADGAEILVAQLERGDYFGERALLADIPRAATCRSKTRVQVLSLDKEDFDELVAKQFQVGADLGEAMERAELLGAMPLFAEVSPAQVKALAAKLTPESYPAGTPITRQGDEGDKFYLVKSGTVQVLRRFDGADEPVLVGRIGAGEYFGEIALLMNVPRTADVVAETPIELLSLDAASFDEMVGDYLQSRHGLEQASSRRIIQLRRAESLGYRTAE